MIYDKKDIDKILIDIEMQYGLSNVYHIDTTQSIEKNTKAMSYQMMATMIASDILSQIKQKLAEIEQIDVFNSSLDIPTKCSNCFAKRDNGICWICAFTGDMSESGFFQKYDIMENCPFLTQKKIDDLAYDFLHEFVASSYQEFADDLDSDWRDKTRKSIQESIDSLFGDGNSD